MKSRKQPFTPEILLVEDNPGDVRLIREALRESGRGSHPHVVDNGVKALAFLRREPGFEDAVQPDLIFLDLNLPRMSGREVLQELKSDPRLRSIPVVVFTSSEADTDVARAYDLHANCYVTKPVDLDRFIAVVQAVESFWLGVALSPPVECGQGA
ncbi:MAG: response regulator [Gemmatimonadota bacterium]|jgi:CheY-like chemotaxis protein|nr:response regulator [Gemmatimonadota bacterium]